MLEARAHRDAVPGQQRPLSRAAGQTFECDHAMFDGELTDRIHMSIEIERRQARPALLNLGDAQPDLPSNDCQWIRGNGCCSR